MPSTDKTIEPENCRNMAEVRDGVDTVDRALVALLAQRFAYMDAAARIKTDRQSVRDEARKAQVLSNIADEANAVGLPVAPLVSIWDRLVEASIDYEFGQWDEREL
jgi:isochorismate pyruvate lyase